ncbi:MAG: FHA domain-containing protein [Bdellovibrionales bacterium]|nr:FHA domain-containing protein [Bdellovibrionales bacterium]NQZ18836.1 FHA domain-containing protein [Bdellovibrionales bacterium]
MRLFLEVIQGPDTGQQINLKKSKSIGRKGADILLNDPKLSGIHAVFKYDSGRGWFVVDNNSRNGVWVKGIREHAIGIEDGMEVQIGGTILRCRIIVKSTNKVEAGFVQWLESLLKKVKDRQLTMKEIKPEMRLRVVQGLQYGEMWDIFYGPRLVGKEQLDICLYDEEAPSEAFEILVKKRYPYFRTQHPDIVKINGESVKDKQLVPGDIIKIGESEILVEFDNGHGFSS